MLLLGGVGAYLQENFESLSSRDLANLWEAVLTENYEAAKLMVGGG